MQLRQTMGYQEHPWVMVRHGEDHVHIVVSRVSDTGQVWHARQDFRAAQSAATALEKHFNLVQAPRQKAPGRARASEKTITEKQQQAAVQLGEQRAEALAEFLEAKRLVDLSFPNPPRPGTPAKGPRTRRSPEVMKPPVRDQRPERGFER